MVISQRWYDAKTKTIYQHFHTPSNWERRHVIRIEIDADNLSFFLNLIKRRIKEHMKGPEPERKPWIGMQLRDEELKAP